MTIAALYKSRWQVELFFKWIKQHLRIKRFLGTSENAMKTQVWCAIATYVLIAIVKKELHLDASLYTCLQSRPCKIRFEDARHARCLRGAVDRELVAMKAVVFKRRSVCGHRAHATLAWSALATAPPATGAKKLAPGPDGRSHAAASAGYSQRHS